MIFPGSVNSIVLAFTIWSNILLFAFIFGMLEHASREDDGVEFNAALTFFAIAVLSRYFDMFFDLLPKSLFFTLGGLVLLAIGGFYERKRNNFKSARVKISHPNGSRPNGSYQHGSRPNASHPGGTRTSNPDASSTAREASNPDLR
jgi:hypothetical protein